MNTRGAHCTPRVLCVLALSTAFAGAGRAAADIPGPVLRLETVLSEADRTRAAATAASQTPLSAPPLTLHATTKLGGRIADPAPAKPARIYRGEVIDTPLALVVNGVPRGEIFAKIAADDDFLVNAADLAERGLHGIEGERFQFDGAMFLSLRSIPGARVTFDDKNLILSVVLPAKHFESRTFDLKNQASPDAVRTADTSAFVNYRLGYASASGGAGSWTLSTEAAARWGGVLFRTESSQLRSGGSTQSLRLQSQAILDDRDNARRLTVGDFIAASGDLGATLGMGGVGFARNYRLTPYFVYQPSAAYSGSVTLPSEVQVYVGGLQVFRQQLSPGPFTLRNFTYYGGRRDVNIVVRDSLGREQAVGFPYYFTDVSLSEGLHDYGYFAGWLRRNFSVESNDYGPFALSAIHRYGVNDNLTLGLRGEASEGRLNLGPQATVRSDRFGTLSAGLSASRDGDRARTDWAAVAAYQFQATAFTARLGVRRFGDDYVLADPQANTGLVRREMNAGIGYGTALTGTVDLAYSRIVPRDSPALRTVGITYSRSLFSRVSLFGTWRRRLDAPRENEFFLGLFYNPDPVHNVSLFHTRLETSSTSVAQLSRSVGPGEGLGYRLSLEGDRGEMRDAWRVSPFVEYASRLGTASAEVRNEYAGGQRLASTRSVALQGGLTYVGNSIQASRFIYDSFGLVKLTPPLAGVRIYQNNQEIGRTDSRGELSIQNLGSFIDNQIAMEDKDIPIAYSIDRASWLISPPYRSGSLVAFSLTRVRAVAGRLLQRVAGATKPLEYHEASVTVGDRKIAFPTGTGGDFYIDSISPGTHRGQVITAAGRCAFTLRIPEGEEAVIEIREPIVCEPTP